MFPSARLDRRAIPPAAAERPWAAADGHSIRTLEWPAPAGAARGALLFMPGRGDAYEKYLEAFEHWRGRGWQVGAADWRGQAGSGRLGLDAATGHIADFAHWMDDLQRLWRSWSARHRGPWVLAAHSMGGHLALRALAERRLTPRPAALVLSAPMLDMVPERLPMALRRGLARVMCALGDPRRPAWQAGERPGPLVGLRGALLTHDADRYADELWWRQVRADLAMGPASWGWVRSALASIRALAAPGLLEAVDVPVFIVATRNDRLVGARAIARAAQRLPQAQVLWFGKEARHEILREADPVRERALAGIDRFLEAALETALP